MSTVAKEATTKQQANPSEPMIKALRTEYERALTAARKLQDMTDTAAWQAGYALIQRQIKDARERFTKRLAQLQGTAPCGWQEPDRKELKDIAKESEAIENAHAVVTERTILPLRQVVDECRHILDHHMTRAKDTAAKEAMFAGQILQDMEAAIALLPKVQWVEESGRVVVTE
jgi:hypothetical protein